MKTRSNPKSKTKSKETQANEEATLPEIAPKELEKDENPPRLFVLPKIVGDDARIITLAHPRTLEPARYVCCPQSGFYEFKRLSAPPTEFRSCLLEVSEDSEGGNSEDVKDGILQSTNSESDKAADGSSLTGRYAMKTPEIFTATQIDPIFLILPALSPVNLSSKNGERKTLFLQSDDLLDRLYEISKDLREVLSYPRIRALLESRLEAASDTVEAGDEKMYRLSESKLLSELVGKAKRVMSKGLPRSMEEKFVTKPLEKPMLAVKNDVTIESEARVKTNGAVEGSQDSMTESTESQSSSTTLASLESQASVSTTITIPNVTTEDSIPPQILELQRLHVALDFMMSSYVPQHLAQKLYDMLHSSDSPVDFKILDEYLADIATLKAEAAEQRKLGGDFTRKRGFEDDETAAEREEKRLKKEEEEKRKKAGESKAVRDLKKADVSGMKKMSDFFKKAPAKPK